MSKYKIKIKGAPHIHKHPLFCPHCRKISGTLDDKYFEQYGFCAECYVMHVESRKKPNIDLLKYAPPGGLFERKTQEEVDSYFNSEEK